MGLLKFTRDSKSQINGFAMSNFAGAFRHRRFDKGHLQFIKE
jgi:hypothetical protein